MIEKKVVIEIPNEDRPLERARTLKAMREFEPRGPLSESLKHIQHHLKDVQYNLYFEAIEIIEDEELEKAMKDGEQDAVQEQTKTL
tara:strand:+ start:626 stop:883 length:258 start_codon:yes stop_codon:yes gene_type:complete